MSADTYFCFCCLSTSDLTNIFGLHSDINYARLIKDLFMIESYQNDQEDDYYICDRCAGVVKYVDKFKMQLLETLDVLQAHGLITIEKKNGGHISLKKGTIEDDEKKLYLDKLNEENVFVMVIENERAPNSTGKYEEIKTETAQEVKSHDLQDTPNTAKTKEQQPLVKQLQESDVDRLTCRHCDSVLPNVYMLHRHMNVHFPNHICEACGKGFFTEKRLKRHIRSHDQGPFACSKCDQQFKNYNTFSSHKRRKHDRKPVKKCVQCLKLRCSCLDDVPLYRCTQCEQAFFTSSSLYSHKLYRHNRAKRHFCQHCELAFFHKQDLVAHESVHTGLLPFKCNLCVKSYPRRKSLIVHMRTHTNDRRFVCDVCGKKFIQKCTLITHLKVHNQKTDVT